MRRSSSATAITCAISNQTRIQINQQQDRDRGRLKEMNRRHWRDRLLVDAIVQAVGDSAENENRNQDD